MLDLVYPAKSHLIVVIGFRTFPHTRITQVSSWSDTQPWALAIGHVIIIEIKNIGEWPRILDAQLFFKKGLQQQKHDLSELNYLKLEMVALSIASLPIQKFMSLRYTLFGQSGQTPVTFDIIDNGAILESFSIYNVLKLCNIVYFLWFA